METQWTTGRRLAIAGVVVGIITLVVCAYFTNSLSGKISRLKAITSSYDIYENYDSKYYKYEDELQTAKQQLTVSTIGVGASIVLVAVCLFVLPSTKEIKDLDKLSKVENADSINNVNDLSDKLFKLKSLRDNELISEEDYERKKQEILNSL